MGFFPGMKHCKLFNGGCSLLVSSNVKKTWALDYLVAYSAVTKFSWTQHSPYTCRRVQGPFTRCVLLHHIHEHTNASVVGTAFATWMQVLEKNAEWKTSCHLYHTSCSVISQNAKTIVALGSVIQQFKLLATWANLCWLVVQKLLACEWKCVLVRIWLRHLLLFEFTSSRNFSSWQNFECVPSWLCSTYKWS